MSSWDGKPHRRGKRGLEEFLWTTDSLLVNQIILFILNELVPWKWSQRARQFSLWRLAAKESRNALIINESINFGFPPSHGVSSGNSGSKLFRELESEDALYRVSYVEINYFLTWQYAVVPEHVGRGVFLSQVGLHADFHENGNLKSFVGKLRFLSLCVFDHNNTEC